MNDKTVTSVDESAVRQLCDLVRRSYPQVAGGLIDQAEGLTDDDWQAAALALEFICTSRSRSVEELDAEIDAFAETSFEFLRLQARFLGRGTYAAGSASELVESVYANSEYMEETYLDGLLLTYCLWPNHVRSLSYFVNRFLPALRSGARVVEIGVGHGLMAFALLRSVSDVRYVGLDISLSSLSVARSSLEACGIDLRQTEWVNADATSVEASLGEFDALVCSEVLEHVDDPLALLRGLRSLAAPDSIVYATTVANLEAIDHVYLYADLDAIHGHLDQAGLAIIDERVWTLPSAGNDQIVPFNYAVTARVPLDT